MMNDAHRYAFHRLSASAKKFASESAFAQPCAVSKVCEYTFFTSDAPLRILACGGVKFVPWRHGVACNSFSAAQMLDLWRIGPSA